MIVTAPPPKKGKGKKVLLRSAINRLVYRVYSCAAKEVTRAELSSLPHFVYIRYINVSSSGSPTLPNGMMCLNKPSLGYDLGDAPLVTVSYYLYTLPYAILPHHSDIFQ